MSDARSVVLGLCNDLAVERSPLLDVVGDAASVGVVTPAPGWSIRDQLTHLAWFDQAALQAIVDPVAFRAHRAEVVADVEAFVEGIRARNEERSREDVIAWLTDTGAALVAAAVDADPTVRVPWYGPDMTIASCITARIMETWGHGQDVRDALGKAPSTANLHHVAFIGWRAIPNSFRARSLPVPDSQVRVEVGELTFGPEDARDRVTGSLLDFCLVVTQRRHVDDTDLHAEGPVANAWLPIAQAFAGPPGPGRTIGQFR